jgi:photosystem II stability/assembly factor-like uncharacterized protein
LTLFLVGTGLAATGQAACLPGGNSLDTATLDDVVPHPTEAETLFAIQNPASGDGIALLKSCDSGVTWSATALTSDFYSVSSLAIDPVNGEDAYAMTDRGPMVSSDGGITWSETELPSGTLVFGNDGTLYSFSGNSLQKRPPGQPWMTMTPVPSPFSVLRQHPADPARIHVGQYYSVDGGGSWQPVLPAAVGDLRFSPSDPMRMIASATPALLSTDGGVNWGELPLEEFEIFATTGVRGTAVAFDMLDSDTIWVATEDCGLWRSINGGARWQLPMGGLTGAPASCWMGNGYPEVRRFKPSPVDPDRFFAITSDGLFITTDDGSSWAAANGPADSSEPPPPPSPISGDADLALDLFGLPGTFTPPVTLRFSGTITHNGPDTAREVMFSMPADIVSTSHGTCNLGSCDFGDVAPGTVIRLALQREILGGGISARCTGDVFEMSGMVSAATNDPVPGNNVDSVSSTRQNGTVLVSGCSGEGVLQSQGGGGGALGFPLSLVLLIAAIARRSLRQRCD